MTLNPPRRETTTQQVRTSFGRHIEVLIFLAGIVVGYLLCRL